MSPALKVAEPDLHADVLPRELNLPFFMRPEELAHLKGSIHLGALLGSLISTLRRYLGLNAAFARAKKKPLSIHLFLWATGIVMSRQNNLGGPKDGVALLPLLDMFNFAPYERVGEGWDTDVTDIRQDHLLLRRRKEML